MSHSQESVGLHTTVSVTDFRFEFEHRIEYENDVSILVFTFRMIKYPSRPMPELQCTSLPKTSMNSEGCGNVTGLTLENCATTQSRARSPILSSLVRSQECSMFQFYILVIR